MTRVPSTNSTPRDSSSSVLCESTKVRGAAIDAALADGEQNAAQEVVRGFDRPPVSAALEQAMVFKDQWGDVDPEALEPWYSYWVSEMTSQGLHSKADIATVLAVLSDRLAKASAVTEVGTHTPLLRGWQLILTELFCT